MMLVDLRFFLHVMVFFMVSVCSQADTENPYNPYEPEQPAPVKTTFDISLVDGEGILFENATVTLKAGQEIRMTCKVTYDRKLGEYNISPLLLSCTEEKG